MRLLVLFLVCSIGLTYAADSYAQKALISIDVRNQRVEDILKEIEEQSDFDFFFNNKHVDLNRRVSVSADKSNIFSVLKEIFSGTNVKYSVLDKKIILSIEAQSPEQEKKITVSGTISDAQGEPIIGASVLEKGVQANGTITDIDGNFKISVSSSKAQLVLAALVCVATMVVQIPSPMQGYVNLGDCFVLLSGWLLGPWYGFAAGGIGSMLADIFLGYAHYAPGTLVIKGVMAQVAAQKYEKMGRTPTSRIAGGVVSEIIMVLGYFGYASLLLGKGLAAAASIPGNIFQGVVGLVVGVLLVTVLERAKVTEKLA